MLNILKGAIVYHLVFFVRAVISTILVVHGELHTLIIIQVLTRLYSSSDWNGITTTFIILFVQIMLIVKVIS